MNYQETRAYLEEMAKYGSVLGLESISGLLQELGDPQKALKYIHIAGTNGKGSILAYTSTILNEAGYTVGRYISPTVVSYLEKIQINGEWIDEESFARLTTQVKAAVEQLAAAGKPLPTVFEAETAIAFLYFKEKKCDLVVLECGLGGATDATNVIENTVCAVFASISRDHIGVIGDTIEEIARTKAGIIKKGCTVVSAPQTRQVTEILQETARLHGCPFAQADRSQLCILREDWHGSRISYKAFQELEISLAGRNQTDNAATALEVVESLRQKGYPIGDDAVVRGMKRVQWPGRFMCIGERPVTILDGAHNEDAALRLRESVEQYFPDRKLIFVMGVFRDKEYEKMARLMAPLAASIYTVDLPDKRRGLPAQELAETLRQYCPQVTAAGEPEKAVRAALAEACEEDVVLVFGSLSYLTVARQAFERRISSPHFKCAEH